MNNKVTIKDVAKLAGVSISTVSRVINDSKPVTDEVKQRVFAHLPLRLVMGQ